MLNLIWKRFKPVKADGVVDEGDLPDDGDGEEGLSGGSGRGRGERVDPPLLDVVLSVPTSSHFAHRGGHLGYVLILCLSRCIQTFS